MCFGHLIKCIVIIFLNLFDFDWNQLNVAMIKKPTRNEKQYIKSTCISINKESNVQ